MGNTFTILGRHALKRARRYNIQTRTEKYLEKHKDKPERAPLYEATMQEVEKLMKELPDTTEEIKKKDRTLLNNLNQVYVTSTGDNKDSFSTKRVDCSGEARFFEAMNINREQLPAIPPGKYSMEQAVQIMSLYQTNPMMNTPKALATKFDLEPSVIAKITKHVKILDYFDTKRKASKKELQMRDLLPRSFQGKTEFELMEELEVESVRRSALLFKKTAKLRASKEERLLESDELKENLLSLETATKKDQIYADLEIYRKTGELPTGPKLIEGSKLEELRIEDIKKLDSGKDSSSESTENNDKEKDKKDVLEDKQKAANSSS